MSQHVEKQTTNSAGIPGGNWPAILNGRAMDLQTIQRVRKAVLFAGIAVSLAALLISVPYWSGATPAHEALEHLGLVLIAACIAGRTWASLFIGGKKKRQLVTHGPYSMMRNPLYTFTILGAAGVGLEFGAVSVAVFGAAFAYITFRLVVACEEVFLREKFGAEYESYLASVPRFVPDMRLWHAPETIDVEPRLVWQTFRDALVLLLAVPIMELLEEAHAAGLLPTLFTLY